MGQLSLTFLYDYTLISSIVLMGIMVPYEKNKVLKGKSRKNHLQTLEVTARTRVELRNSNIAIIRAALW